MLWEVIRTSTQWSFRNDCGVLITNLICFFSYANLKPPSSPSPSKPSGGKIGEINETVATPIAPDTPSTEPVLDGISQTTSISEVKKSLSPYAA